MTRFHWVPHTHPTLRMKASQHHSSPCSVSICELHNLSFVQPVRQSFLWRTGGEGVDKIIPRYGSFSFWRSDLFYDKSVTLFGYIYISFPEISVLCCTINTKNSKQKYSVNGWNSLWISTALVGIWKMSQKRDFEEGKARVEGGSSEDKRRRFKRFNFVSVSRVYHDVVKSNQ